MGKKFQERFAESRFFAMSLIIHVLLVFFAGTIVFYKAYVAPDDFVGASIDSLATPIDELTFPPERPPEPGPQEPPKPQAPVTGSPIDRVTTIAPTPIKVPSAPVPTINPKRPIFDSATSPIAKNPPGGTFKLPTSMIGRLSGAREDARKRTDGKPASELAVLRGLNWLQQNQEPDGSWGEKNKGAMTGLALLCFLGHGETPDSAQYGYTINNAVQWFLDEGTKHQGRLHMADAFSQSGVYEHGIGTYALGEYFTMTRDERVLELYKQAVGYIVQGQGPGGGWMYSYDKTGNDLSVSGWQIQALKAAHLTGLQLPGVDDSLDRAVRYLSNVKGPNGGYGYREAADKYSLTGVGILSILFWKGEPAEIRKGMDWMLNETDKKYPVKYKGEHADLYAWYYHTQACLMAGGHAWQKWNRWFQDELVGAQNPDGSWPVPGGKPLGPAAEGSKTGAVYRTTLCILMLEVFYRYMPATKG